MLHEHQLETSAKKSAQKVLSPAIVKEKTKRLVSISVNDDGLLRAMTMTLLLMGCYICSII